MTLLFPNFNAFKYLRSTKCRNKTYFAPFLPIKSVIRPAFNLKEMSDNTKEGYDLLKFLILQSVIIHPPQQFQI